MVDDRGRAKSLQPGSARGYTSQDDSSARGYTSQDDSSARGYTSQKRTGAKSAGCGALLLCCALAAGAWAAEEPVPAADQLPAASAEEIDSDASPRIETAEETQGDTSETAASETPDTFIPSEDISENISVKFPVDI